MIVLCVFCICRGRHIPDPYTPPYVDHTPDVYKITLDKKKDKFVILATDGLWDFMDPQEAVDVVVSASDPKMVRVCGYTLSFLSFVFMKILRISRLITLLLAFLGCRYACGGSSKAGSNRSKL